MSNRMQEFHADISHYLEQIAKLFKKSQGVKITIVIRTPMLQDGGVLLSDDDLDLAIAEINRLRTKDVVAP